MAVEVAVVLNSSSDSAGYFKIFAEAQGIHLREFRVSETRDLPDRINGFAGLCVMGGIMSANDDLPWLRQIEVLIRDAVANKVPVIGHCLGGQLLAKALGGEVRKAVQPEIGWVTTRARAGGKAAEWFGLEEFPIYHWHYDSFSIPAGAEHLATSRYCENQAFAVDGIHLGMQFHCEITDEKIDQWLAEETCQRQIAELSSRHESVQHLAAMRADTTRNLSSSYSTAASIYQRWIAGLKR